MWLKTVTGQRKMGQATKLGFKTERIGMVTNIDQQIPRMRVRSTGFEMGDLYKVKQRSKIG